MNWAPYFWPIEEFKEWKFRSTVAPILDHVHTQMTTTNIAPSGDFMLLIEKTSPFTYWGPEVRWEDCNIHCKMDEHGISMLSYDIQDVESEFAMTKEFVLFTDTNNSKSPWVHSDGFPVYPFIPEGVLTQLDLWFTLHQKVIQIPGKIHENHWQTRASIETIFVPYLHRNELCLRMDYLETNTPCHRFSEQVTPIDFGYNWAKDTFDGPEWRRPIRVNETWWFAYGLGPVKVHHEHNKYENGMWSGPCDVDWKYAPYHEIELMAIQ